MKQSRKIAKYTAYVMAVAAFAAMFGLGTRPAFAQSRADREQCAESVGIQTRQDGRNSWIKRRVSSKTYNAFLRCTDAIATKQAEAKPKGR